jgi:hypothetical protein
VGIRELGNGLGGGIVWRGVGGGGSQWVRLVGLVGWSGGWFTTYLPGFIAVPCLPTETLLPVLGSIRALRSSLA